MINQMAKNIPFQQTKPSGTFFPQELNTRLIATGILNFKSPNTFPLIAVHRHNAASRSANPSKTAQHSALGFAPITSCTIPSQSPQTPNLRVSLGHFSGVGAGFGVGGGQGAGFGDGGGTGTGFGGHVALVDETQNYDLPNIKNLFESTFVEGKGMEERHKVKGPTANPKGS